MVFVFIIGMSGAHNYKQNWYYGNKKIKTISTRTNVTRQLYRVHADTAIMLLLSAAVLMPSVRMVVPGIPVRPSPCLCATATSGPLRVGQIDS